MFEFSARKTAGGVHPHQRKVDEKDERARRTGPDLEHTLHVGGDAHLLCELRALGEEGGAAEVVHLENGGAGLGARLLELAAVDLEEAACLEEGAEEPAYAGVDAEDCMTGRSLRHERPVEGVFEEDEVVWNVNEEKNRCGKNRHTRRSNTRLDSRVFWLTRENWTPSCEGNQT